MEETECELWNPPPPSDASTLSQISSSDGRIPGTAYDTTWIYSTFLNILNEVESDVHANRVNPMVPLRDDIEAALCNLWDASAETVVAEFIFHEVDLSMFLLIVKQSQSCRIDEVYTGILGNMMCYDSIRCNLQESHLQILVDTIAISLSSFDPPTRHEAIRLLKTMYSSMEEYCKLMQGLVIDHGLVSYLQEVFTDARFDGQREDAVEVCCHLVNVSPCILSHQSAAGPHLTLSTLVSLTNHIHQYTGAQLRSRGKQCLDKWLTYMGFLLVRHTDLVAHMLTHNVSGAVGVDLGEILCSVSGVGDVGSMLAEEGCSVSSVAEPPVPQPRATSPHALSQGAQHPLLAYDTRLIALVILSILLRDRITTYNASIVAYYLDLCRTELVYERAVGDSDTAMDITDPSSSTLLYHQQFHLYDNEKVGTIIVASFTALIMRLHKLNNLEDVISEFMSKEKDGLHCIVQNLAILSADIGAEWTWYDLLKPYLTSQSITPTTANDTPITVVVSNIQKAPCIKIIQRHPYILSTSPTSQKTKLDK